MLRRVTVSGLRCSHCAEILVRDLRRIPGVRHVELVPRTGEITIDASPYAVSEGMIVAAIRDSGYRVRQPAAAAPADPADETPGAGGPNGGGEGEVEVRDDLEAPGAPPEP